MLKLKSLSLTPLLYSFLRSTIIFRQSTFAFENIKWTMARAAPAWKEKGNVREESIRQLCLQIIGVKVLFGRRGGLLPKKNRRRHKADSNWPTNILLPHIWRVAAMDLVSPEFFCCFRSVGCYLITSFFACSRRTLSFFLFFLFFFSNLARLLCFFPQQCPWKEKKKGEGG